MAESTAEDYKITAKKEMLDQVIRSEMISQATLGKVATLGEIAEVIRRQDGIKDVQIDGDKDATERYIYVETTDRRLI